MNFPEIGSKAVRTKSNCRIMHYRLQLRARLALKHTAPAIGREEQSSR